MEVAGLDAATLRGKKTSELRALAKQMRLPPAAVDDAMDTDDPKAALIALVLAAGSGERALEPDAAPTRAGLAAMKNAALVAQALHCGVSKVEVDEAMDVLQDGTRLDVRANAPGRAPFLRRGVPAGATAEAEAEAEARAGRGGRARTRRSC
jgi:hypothetical protein